MGKGLCTQRQATYLWRRCDELTKAWCLRQYRLSGGFFAEFKEISMFFVFAIPAILETVITIAASTIVARVASDLYDKVTTTDDDE